MREMGNKKNHSNEENSHAVSRKKKNRHYNALINNVSFKSVPDMKKQQQHQYSSQNKRIRKHPQREMPNGLIYHLNTEQHIRVCSTTYVCSKIINGVR